MKYKNKIYRLKYINKVANLFDPICGPNVGGKKSLPRQFTTAVSSSRNVGPLVSSLCAPPVKDVNFILYYR